MKIVDFPQAFPIKVNDHNNLDLRSGKDETIEDVAQRGRVNGL